MKFWPLFPLLLLIQQPILLGQGSAGFTDLERKGDDALAAGLWEVAELHFRRGLADPTLAADAKSQMAIRLAESLIRAGNAKEAQELLGQSFVAKNPATRFWTAQALAAENRFSEAVGIFQSLLADPKTPHRTEAKGADPIVVVGTTRDPATPYKWSRSLAEQLSSGTLLTYEGDGHTAYGRGSDCIDTAINTYLLEGTPPADGKKCT